jgi:hypothetical protein
MSLDTYTNLKTSIADWLKRDNLTSYIPDFITLCETQMQRDFINMNPPPRQMELTATGTTSAGQNTIALPTGYKGTKRFQLQISGSYRALKYKTPEQMAVYQFTGTTEYYTTNGDNLEIGAGTSSTYNYAWTYYKAFDALSGSVASNWVLTANPDLYLYGSLAQAAPYLKNDERIPVWASLYGNALKSFEMANVKDRQSGSTLQMRSDVAF